MRRLVVIIFLLYGVAYGYSRLAQYGTEVPAVDVNKEMTDVYYKLSIHRHIVDSLGLRLDSLSYPQIFYAYDSIGGINIPVMETRIIRLDTEIIKDPIYAHADNDSIVGINQDGLYEINAAASIVADTPTDVAWYLYLYVYTKDAWYYIPYGLAYGHSGSLYSSPSSLAIDAIYPFDSGDSIQIRIVSIAGDNITTVAGTVHLFIEKIR